MKVVKNKIGSKIWDIKWLWTNKTNNDRAILALIDIAILHDVLITNKYFWQQVYGAPNERDN